ncbi:hypothetical protein [Kitasatospora viridis]|uniref:Secreted protein n=1 Tax=Kitasatospora viridis TaxID=281105 RepID=A0A561UKB7_9ACTN|nr:hypothetical protein [Kitasatospora viridis]TWF99775.1 hypothetical protein FHX73_113630 [Kitasatospora viridis]
MRSGLVQTGAWAVATTAAVLLSWLGVNAVLSDSAFEPPAALPLRHSPSAAPTTVPGTPAAPGAPLAPQPGQEPPTPPAALQSAPTGGHSTPPAATRRPATAAASTPAAGGGTGTVRSYLVPGGRVALDMHPDSAELVSAVPDPGWQMQMWNGDQWMRIDFSQGQSTNSVFVTWNGHAPDVQTVVN